jgi:hypothetical protein
MPFSVTRLVNLGWPHERLRSQSGAPRTPSPPSPEWTFTSPRPPAAATSTPYRALGAPTRRVIPRFPARASTIAAARHAAVLAPTYSHHPSYSSTLTTLQVRPWLHFPPARHCSVSRARQSPFRHSRRRYWSGRSIAVSQHTRPLPQSAVSSQNLASGTLESIHSCSAVQSSGDSRGAHAPAPWPSQQTCVARSQTVLMHSILPGLVATLGRRFDPASPDAIGFASALGGLATPLDAEGPAGADSKSPHLQLVSAQQAKVLATKRSLVLMGPLGARSCANRERSACTHGAVGVITRGAVTARFPSVG